MARDRKSRLKATNERAIKSEENSAFVRLVCIVSAVIAISGIVTIGAMNLLCSDDLYTVYTTAFSAESIVLGITVLVVTVAFMAVAAVMLKNRAFFVFISLAAAAARLAAALFWKIEPESDFKITLDLARIISENPLMSWGIKLDEFGTEYNSIWAAHMPFVIYQGLFLRIWNNELILKLANALFSFGSYILIVLAADNLGGERSKRLAAVFASLNPTCIFFVPVLTNQHVSQFFIVAAIYIITSQILKNINIKALLVGFFTGIAQLFRPDAVTLVIAASVYVFFSCIKSGNAKQKFMAFSGGLLVFMAVMIAMNTFLTTAHVIHGNIFSGNLNYKIMVGLNPETNGAWSASDAGLLGNNTAINTMIKSRLTQNPLKLAAVMYGKAVYQLGTYVYTWSYLGSAEWVSQVIMRRVGTALMMSVCAKAAWNMLFRRKREYIWMYFSVAVFAAVYAIIEVQGRYNFIIIPIMILLASESGKE